MEINIDESCKHCKKGLMYLKKLNKQNKKAYMNFILHPIPKSDEEFKKRRIKGIVLSPDYNSSGHLTHFHILLEEDFLKKHIEWKK